MRQICPLSSPVRDWQKCSDLHGLAKKPERDNERLDLVRWMMRILAVKWLNLAGHLIISILAKASMRLRNAMPVKTSAAFGQENSKTLMFGVKVTKLTDKIKINFFGIA